MDKKIISNINAKINDSEILAKRSLKSRDNKAFLKHCDSLMNWQKIKEDVKEIFELEEKEEIKKNNYRVVLNGLKKDKLALTNAITLLKLNSGSDLTLKIYEKALQKTIQFIEEFENEKFN